MESNLLNRTSHALRTWMAGGLCLLALVACCARAARAGIGDSPLPRFADGKPSVRIAAIPGVVKRGSLQTDFLCTSFDSTPVDIGVEIFDTNGPLLNDVSAGVGAVLNVGPGQTVTIGTSGTATFLESAVIPLTSVSQGSARMVASSTRVRCNAILLDDTASPPTGLATLRAGVQPAPGAVPPGVPLPEFAGGRAATHAGPIPGVVKRGQAETVVFCTSLATTPIDIGVEIFRPDGTVANSVAAGNGAVLDVAPGATVTFGTTGTAAFFETTVISTAGIAQGMARVVSTSPQVTCAGLMLDSAVTPPTFASDLPGALVDTTTVGLPSPLPRFSDGKSSVAIMTIPGVVKRGRLQTDVLCTSFESSPVNIGVEIFDSSGTLLNNVTAGAGALLNVGPAQTVTIATSGTATFLESAFIPLSGVAQGSARVVASASGVRCNAVILDDAVSPPVSLATLGEGTQPAAGAVPSSVPLPQFADGQRATHAIVVPGVVKRGNVQTSFMCTSFASANIDVGVEIFGPDGTPGNSVASGNGAVLNVPPGATVSIGSTGTGALLESAVIISSGVAQGFARVVSTSRQLSCNALVLDAAATPPAAMSSLIGWTVECAGGAIIAMPQVKIMKNLDPAGDERFTLQGEITLTPPIDPLAYGVRFQIQDSGGASLFTRVVPGGAKAGATAPGWMVNATGTRWIFRDRFGLLPGGISRVMVSDRSQLRPGAYKFKLSGRKADFQVTPSDLPVRVLVVLGDGVGQCGTLAFNAAGAVLPACTLSTSGNTVSCR